MSDQNKSSSRGWLVLTAIVIFAAFVFFVPVKTSTGLYGYSKTTWDIIVGNF